MDSRAISNTIVSPFYMEKKKINITKFHVLFISKYLKEAKAQILV